MTSLANKRSCAVRRMRTGYGADGRINKTYDGHAAMKRKLRAISRVAKGSLCGKG